MKPFSKILVPFDFSACAEQALQVAADMSRRYEAPLCVLHVYEPMLYSVPEPFAIYTAQQEPTLLAQYETLLGKAAHDARAAGAVLATTKLLQGVAVSEIVRFTHDGKFDLIVMGTHGRTGIAHALIGSVAERVVRRAGCPVLAVRQPEIK